MAVSHALLACSLLACLPTSPRAIAFPDTAALKKEYRVTSRKDGRPALLSRREKGDSLSLALEWSEGKVVSARLEQPEPFDPGAFEDLATAYGAGAAWHEFDDGKRPYPGLIQQWYLRGYGGETGWLGAGVDRGRHFLIFRALSPSSLAKVDAPLALLPAAADFLDTSSEWLEVPCRERDWGTRPDKPASGKPGKLPLCYRPGADSRMWIRISRLKPLALQVRFEEEGSAALRDIRRVVQTIPDASQAEYAEDLAQMLQGEAQMFLAKLAQRLPGLFNWPSWQLQGMKEGRTGAKSLLAIIRDEREPGDYLPAMRLEGKRIRLAINLYYQGTILMEAEAIP
jgi:hypothetical protein